MRYRPRFTPVLGAVVIGAILAQVQPAHAQGTGGIVVSDSKVGYIDSALIGSIFRLRFDAAYDNHRPSRAEFFYAQTAPGGPGLPRPEPNVDYQDISAYVEHQFCSRFSAFLDVPTRFLNPEVNANSAGLADLNAGLRFAVVQDEAQVLTLQFRTYAPTGEADRGLGTHHVSLEPALLYYRALGDRAALESELRYWVPVGGTDFAGDVIRYGAGVSYEIFNNGQFRLSPVVEFVGWTALGGKESVILPSGVQVQDAAGDTIINGKIGLRMRLGDNADFYGGYGRPLTGERWYNDTYRFELRLLF